MQNNMISTTNDKYHKNDNLKKDIITLNVNMVSDIMISDTDEKTTKRTAFIRYVKQIEEDLTLLKKEKCILVSQEHLDNLQKVLDELYLNTSKSLENVHNEFICITLRNKDNVYCNRCFSLNKLHPKRDNTVTLAELIFFWSKYIDTIYIAISTFHRQTRKEYLRNRKTKDDAYITCGRFERFALKTNVLICTIGLNKIYSNLEATEAWDIIQEENKEFFNAFNIMVTSNGTKLQICLKIENFSLRSKQSKLMWKMLNEAFNDILKQYGCIKYYANDITQALCIKSNLNNVNDTKSCIIKHFSIESKKHDIKYLIQAIRKYTNYLDSESEKFIIRNNNEVLKAILDIKQSKDDNTLSFEDLLDDFEEKNDVQNIKDIQKSEAGKKGKAIMLKNRKQDIFVYCKRRKYDLGKKRKDVIFIYGKIILSCHLHDREGLKKQLLYLNNHFTNPLDVYEIDKIINYLENSNFFSITNTSIMKRLEFTDDDIKEMSSSYSIEKMKEKARIRKAKQREQQKKEKIKNNILTKKEEKTIYQLILLEKNKNLGNKELMEILKISQSTLTRLKNKLKCTA